MRPASALRPTVRALLALVLGALLSVTVGQPVSAAPGEPVLTPGPQTDPATWDSVISTLVPMGLAATDSFEAPDFAVNDSLAGVTTFDGFSMTVSSPREADVDGAEYLTNPRTGAQQATFRWAPSSIIIDILPDVPAVGLGFYVGDLFDGAEGSRVQILGDGVLIGDYTGYVGPNGTGPVVNAVDGSSTTFGNEIFGLVGAWDPNGSVNGFRIIVDAGRGDNFVLDDISVILANPQIGLTKDITDVTTNADGTVSIEYTIVATNTGGVELLNVAVDDDVTSVFGAALQSATRSTDTCTGNSLEEQLLDGSVPVADTQCTIVLDVVISGAPGVFDNVATVEAIDNFDNTVDDVSTDGVDPDPDADNDPSNNSVPTSIELVDGSLELAKSVSGVTDNDDGTFDFVYELEVSAPSSSGTCANDGSDDCYLLPSTNVQVVDDLVAVFGANAIVSASPAVTAGSCTESSTYTGSAPTANLLSGTDDLLPGDSCVIEVSVTVSANADNANDAASGDYTNSAGATSDAITEPVVSEAVVTIVEFAPPVPAPIANPDESLDNVPGSTVTVDPLVNDSGGLDPTTVMILDATGAPVGTLVVPGEGTWTVDPVTGAISFAPEAGFEGDPTPISYRVSDDSGDSVESTVTISYGPILEPDQSLGNPAGSVVELDVLANDPSLDLDPTTVMILDASGTPVSTLAVPGEGTWTVDPVTGAISFAPEAGFDGDPTPIRYVASDMSGATAAAVTVTVTYNDPVSPADSPDTIAFTGAQTWRNVTLGAVLLGLGVALTLYGRREDPAS